MGAPVLGRRSLGTVELDILPDGIESSSYSGLKIWDIEEEVEKVEGLESSCKDSKQARGAS
jgi:hypothetical protein